MKYIRRFKNSEGDEYTISSMEDYVVTDGDVEVFTNVLSDKPVRKYITDDALTKYGHATVRSLAKDILPNSALRWKEHAERRFLVRDALGRAVGMIGVTLKNLEEGELWYYKASFSPPFMYEALVVAMDFLKKEGLKNLFATFQTDNVRSYQILFQLGFEGSLIEGKMSKKLST